MALSKEQLEERRNHIGASDIPALLGYSSYKTAGDLFLEKTGRLVPEESSEAAKRGNRLEPAILDYAEEELGEPLQRNVRVVCKALPVLVSNLDAFAPIRRATVEAKSTVMAQAWADDSEPPESVIAQVHGQLICAEIEVGFVPVLLPYLTFKMYEVKRNPDLCDVILNAVGAFEKCLKSDTPPEHAGYTMDVVKRIKRSLGKVGEVKLETVTAFKQLDAQVKKLEDLREHAKAALVAEIGDCESASYPGGMVTYRMQQQSRLDVTAIRKAYPAIASEYDKIITFPKLGWK